MIPNEPRLTRIMVQDKLLLDVDRFKWKQTRERNFLGLWFASFYKVEANTNNILWNHFYYFPANYPLCTYSYPTINSFQAMEWFKNLPTYL